MSRKTRADSFWDNQPAARLAELETWLFEQNVSYEEAVKRYAGFGGETGSVASLARWRSRRAQERMLERITSSARQANAVVEKFQENPANTYSALLQMVGQAAFDAQLHGQTLDLSTLKDLAELTGLGLKAAHDQAVLAMKEKDLALKERRVKLLEEKARQADQAKDTVSDKKLSPEEKDQRLRQIFGMT
jgi:hypothetical protein